MANRRLVAGKDSGRQRSDSMAVPKCYGFSKPGGLACSERSSHLTRYFIRPIYQDRLGCVYVTGERNYENLQGDTGPLVYPAGFLYLYSAIQYITGGNVFPAQVLFGVLYIVNLGIVFLIYVKTDVLPLWAFCLLCLSKRIHSIFVLRLFNDCFAMTFLHAALALILYQRWHLGLIVFSGAVSIKMNVLLYAPPLLLLLLKGMHVIGVVTALFSAALVQIALGLPFLLSHPLEYISRAFNLGRVFIHFWLVVHSNARRSHRPVFRSDR